MMALLYDNTPNIMGEARSLADSPYDQPEATERLEIYKYQNGAFAVSEYNPYLMNFGMGCYMKPYDAFMKPAGELSVMCHEFTHLINRKTANLGSNNDETGALNESFSDLMAISMAKSAEYGYGPQTPWLVGGHDFISGHSCLRNMAEPKKGLDGKVPGCDTYKGENWKDDKYAMAGVQNKFYCLLCDGGSGTNDHGYAYAMEGIGVEKGCQIAYLTLTKYASADSDYADIRRCFLAAAAELYGQGSAEVTAVGQAWDAVGVYENGVQPTGISAVSQSGQYKSAHAVFDLQGRQVSQSSAGQVKPGLYIRNGKKYVAR